MVTRKVVLIVTVIVVLLAGCGGRELASSNENKASDPIVGVWSTDSLCQGGLWVGYTPKGQVVYMLDPSKAPGTLCSPDIVNAIYDSTGEWDRDGSTYKVVQSRKGQ